MSGRKSADENMLDEKNADEKIPDRRKNVKTTKCPDEKMNERKYA